MNLRLDLVQSYSLRYELRRLGEKVSAPSATTADFQALANIKTRERRWRRDRATWRKSKTRKLPAKGSKSYYKVFKTLTHGKVTRHARVCADEAHDYSSALFRDRYSRSLQQDFNRNRSNTRSIAAYASVRGRDKPVRPSMYRRRNRHTQSATSQESFHQQRPRWSNERVKLLD